MKAISIRLFFLLSLLVLLIVACNEKSKPQATIVESNSSRSNTNLAKLPRPETVLIIMIDTLRADALGTYGSNTSLTPRLDAFAQHAVVFQNAYSTSAWTRSAVASMLTGRYPSSHTVLSKLDSLPEAALLLPEILEASQPTWSFGITTNANTSASIGFGQGFDHYGPLTGVKKNRYPGEKIGLVPGPVVSQAALTLLNDARAESQTLKFGFIQYIDPHDPYYPNPGLLPTSEPAGKYSGSRKDIDAMVAAGKNALSQKDMARLRYLYDGEVAFVDKAFGELIEGLKRNGQFENALIIAVADHGEAFWEHGKRGHGKSLYEEETRVPLLIKFPGDAAMAQQIIKQPVSIVDITPTILDSLSIKIPTEIEGRSLLPLINGQPREARVETIFSELHLFKNKSVSMVRQAQFKLIATYLHKQNKVQLSLFNLGKDPHEKHNLIDQAEYSVQQNRLTGALSAWESDVLDWSLDKQSVELEEMDEEMVDELKGLGYIK